MRLNFKKQALITICAIAVLLIFVTKASYAEEKKYIRTNGVSLTDLNTNTVEGKVHLAGESEKVKIKALVIKDKEQQWLDIDLENGKFDKDIWLTQGKGKYTIAIMVHEYDRKYSYGPRIEVENALEVNKYLVPTKYVESNSEDIISLAKEITKGKEKDLDKARAIYEWVSKNIKYDNEKYTKHLADNYDNSYGALNTLKTRKGVCFDYAALTAALGRAIRLEVKMVKGEAVNGEPSTGQYRGLHAWNEIYISEEKRWIKVDTTFGIDNTKNYFDNVDFDESHFKTEEY